MIMIRKYGKKKKRKEKEKERKKAMLDNLDDE